MKRYFLYSLITTVLSTIQLAAASPQVISGAATVALDSDGSKDGVSFINQNVNETTLAVPENSTVNSAKNAKGIATDTNGIGIVDFHGTSGSTDVYGSVGDASLFMDNINIGGTKVTFYDNVHTNGMTFNGNNGFVDLKGTTIVGTGGVVFNVSATLRLDKNVSFTGNITGGGIELDDNATLNGNIAVGTVKYDTQGPDSVQGATINGNVATSVITVGAGDLIINGNLIYNNPDKNVLFLTENNAIATPVYVSGTTTIDGPVTVIYHISKFHAPREGAFEVVYTVSGGTSGASVTVSTDDTRYQSVGSNLNGNITVTSTRDYEAEAGPVQGTGWMFANLIPVAYQNPNSDLDFIEGQLGFPTFQQYNDALYQIAPNIVVAGVGQETFNTTRRFLKPFLEHLLWDPSACCCDCCGGVDVRFWIDGLGSHSHQRGKEGYVGYKANSWATSLMAERSVSCELSAGLGLGYTNTKVALNQYNDVTHINTYQGLAYLRYDAQPWFLDGGAAFGWNHYNTKRHIDFQDTHRRASARYNGQEYTAFAVAGYQQCCQGAAITPFCSLVYSHIDLDRYQESGADTLSLKFKKQHFDYAQSGLGLKGTYALDTCLGCLVPELHTIWMHDFITRPLKVNASFSALAAEGGYFRSTGLSANQNTWNIGGSLNLLNACDITISVLYDYERSRSYYNHEGMLSFTCSF